MTDFSNVYELIHTAGQNLKKHFGTAEALEYKDNYSSSAVTELDRQTENFLAENLRKIDPTVGFKGEEFGISGNKEKFWLVDPIDGTGLFIRGLQGCVTMLALIDKGEVVMSVIYDFVADGLYRAEKGKGAYLNNEKIHVSSRGLTDAFLHIESKLDNQKDIDTYLKIDKICIILGNYPAGMHFAQTAAGKIEGRICMNPYGKDYDFAPGQLLVSEAGGIVANIGAEGFDYTNLNFLAVNPEVYKDLTEGPNAIFPYLSP